MQVREVLVHEVESVGPDTPLIHVARRMREIGIGFMPVVGDEKLAGVVTDRDIVVRCVAEGLEPATTVAQEIMSVEVVCCFGHDDVEHARELMLERGVRRLPIINEEHRLIGVVALPDLEGGPIPRSKSVKVTFHKEKTDSYGRPHKVPVKTVYITGATDREGAESAAVRTVEQQTGTSWTNVATGYESEEEEGTAGRRNAG